MSDQMKTDYKGTEIVYFEGSNEFVFTLRGRACRRGSLLEAKKAIDAPPPKDKVPFERIEAWLGRGYGPEKYTKVTVTSICEKTGWRGVEAWIVGKGESRSKESADNLYPVNQHNDSIVSEIRELVKERDALDKKIDSLAKRMKKLSETLKNVEVE